MGSFDSTLDRFQKMEKGRLLKLNQMREQRVQENIPARRELKGDENARIKDFTKRLEAELSLRRQKEEKYEQERLKKIREAELEQAAACSFSPTISKYRLSMPRSPLTQPREVCILRQLEHIRPELGVKKLRKGSHSSTSLGHQPRTPKLSSNTAKGSVQYLQKPENREEEQSTIKKQYHNHNHFQTKHEDLDEANLYSIDSNNPHASTPKKSAIGFKQINERILPKKELEVFERQDDHHNNEAKEQRKRSRKLERIREDRRRKESSRGKKMRCEKEVRQQKAEEAKEKIKKMYENLLQERIEREERRKMRKEIRYFNRLMDDEEEEVEVHVHDDADEESMFEKFERHMSKEKKRRGRKERMQAAAAGGGGMDYSSPGVEKHLKKTLNKAKHDMY